MSLDIKEGQHWYAVLLNKQPEWELTPGCWLQVAEGVPAEDSGPIRFGVTDIEAEQDRLVEHLRIEQFQIHSREEVPVKWGTFSDPWGNRLGFFQYLNHAEQNERIQAILRK